MTLLDSARGAVLPWNSIDSTLPDVRGAVVFQINGKVDAQEEINKCLSCQRAECTNCLSPKKRKINPLKIIISGQLVLDGFED